MHDYLITREIRDPLTNSRNTMISIIILPPFQIIRLFSIAHIYIDVNESRHTYISICLDSFNIYLNVDNDRKSYNMKPQTTKCSTFTVQSAYF